LITARYMIDFSLDRLQDPQPEGLFTRGMQVVEPRARGLGSLPILTLISGLGLLVVSFAYYLSQYGNLPLEIPFLLGLLLIFVPIAVRLISPAPSRLERICLLCVVGICFFFIHFMISPLYVSGFDEFLHLRTISDIIRTRHLFTENSLLPVSPYFPGLEIVTDSVSAMSGLSTFYAGFVVTMVARLLMILSLFMFYETITQSSRMAGIATLIYMTNPHFILFDAAFSYETLALPLAISMLYVLVRFQAMDKGYRRIIFAAYIIITVLTVTHHMTDYFFDGFLLLWVIVSFFCVSSRGIRRNLIAITLFGILLSLAYAFLFYRNPVKEYLSLYFGTVFTEIGHIITGTSTTRPLFVSQGTSRVPIWDELFMIGLVGLVTFALPFGLLILHRHHRHDALAVTCGIASLAYPISQAFRFTNFGSEITDRSAAFLFVVVAYVLTIFITHFWPTRKLSWKATSFITCALSVIFLGGVLVEVGPGFSSLPGPYMVVADVRSVEPEGIQTALWTLSHLGPGNRIGTDRINQILMLSYGGQTIVTSARGNVPISTVFFSQQFGPQEVAILRQAHIRYLVVDLRLSKSLPLEGFYFENSDPGAFQRTKPISSKVLMKFNSVPQINRVYDSGDIVIYDVGALK
jgi:hypothetical protein